MAELDWKTLVTYVEVLNKKHPVSAESDPAQGASILQAMAQKYGG